MSESTGESKGAGEAKGEAAKADGRKADGRPIPPETAHVTRHTLALDGRVLEYTATASTMLLRGAKDEPRASLFSVAYTLDGADPASRPVTFCFNGGPGSSSVWLHLGAFGPRRVVFPDPEHPAPPPYRLEENDATLLDVSDLVFVDPVGTGLSRAVGDATPEEFLGPTPDVESVSEFVRLWLTRHGRWGSPKLLAGESYGGTRVAAMAPHLHERGIWLNGVILVSPALDFAALEFGPENDLPSVLYLPSYAATALYHGVLPELPRDRDAWLDEVRSFAVRTYAPALLLGARLPDADRSRIAKALAGYTGLSVPWLERNDLRIDVARFTKEILRHRGELAGRLDSRFVGWDDDAGTHAMGRDPSYTAPLGPFAALVQDHLRRELGVTDERHYEVLSLAVNGGWKWEIPKGKSGGYLNVVGALRSAMLDNPHLRVFFANGLYDLATPFFAAEHAASHLGREAHVRRNLTERTYDAGHMMYLHPGSRSQLKRDLAAFYEAAAPAR